jgi:hypothetical protein
VALQCDPFEVFKTDGPTPIVITGANFVNGASLVWGDAPLTTTNPYPAAFISDNQLDATWDPAVITLSGRLVYRVVNPDGQRSNPIEAWVWDSHEAAAAGGAR